MDIARCVLFLCRIQGLGLPLMVNSSVVILSNKTLYMRICSSVLSFPICKMKWISYIFQVFYNPTDLEFCQLLSG